MKEKIRVLQLIDSLSVGGAERMAINIANDLAEEGINTTICTTRIEGELKRFISKNVKYLFVKKKSSFDVIALLKLIIFIKKNRINIVHAHSTSVFWGVLLRMILWNIKLVVHIHSGNLINANQFKKYIYWFVFKLSDSRIVVNNELKEWLSNYYSLSSLYIKNYAVLKKESINEDLILESNNMLNIVHVANLRPVKNHKILLRSVQNIDHKLKFKLYLIGRDYEDDYSLELKKIIKSDTLLKKRVVVLGARTDIANILYKSNIGVICSDSEGLPVSLIEYGLAGLATVSTDVGQCSEVINNKEFLIEKGNVNQLTSVLERLIKDDKYRTKWAIEFHNHVMDNYSKKASLKSIVNCYKGVL